MSGFLCSSPKARQRSWKNFFNPATAEPIARHEARGPGARDELRIPMVDLIELGR